jgi:hypothetical protein
LFRITECAVENLIDQSSEIPRIGSGKGNTMSINLKVKGYFLITFHDPLRISGDAYRPDSGNKLPYVYISDPKIHTKIAVSSSFKFVNTSNPATLHSPASEV